MLPMEGPTNGPLGGRIILYNMLATMNDWLAILLGSDPIGPMSCRTQGWISLHPSIRPSIHPSVRPSVTPVQNPLSAISYQLSAISYQLSLGCFWPRWDPILEQMINQHILRASSAVSSICSSICLHICHMINSRRDTVRTRHSPVGLVSFLLDFVPLLTLPCKLLCLLHSRTFFTSLPLPENFVSSFYHCLCL